MSELNQNNALDFSTDGMETQKDTLRNGDYTTDTGIHLGDVKMAYLGKSSKGATSLTLQIAFPEINKTLTQVLYIASREGKSYSQRQGSDKKNPLPDFTIANELCLATTGNGLQTAYANREVKKVNIYNTTERKEIPTDAEVLVDLIGKKAFFGVHRIRENKNIENPKGSGNWEPGPDERITNKIDKVFNEDKKTVNEVMAGDPAGFYQKWEAEFGTDTIDKYKAVKGGAQSGAPAANRTGGTNDTAIFGD